MNEVLSYEELISIVEAMPGSVAVHTPVFDEHDHIVDARLRWWNSSYGALHNTTSTIDQSMRAVYFEPDSALEYVQRAWDSGAAHQYFSVDGDVLARYSMFDEPITLSVDWLRIGSQVVEIGENLTLLTEIQRQLASSDLELLEAWRIQQIAEAKQRVARDIHDSVMQRLLAVGMGVRLAINTLELSSSNRRYADALQRNLDEAVTELRSMVDALASVPEPITSNDLSKGLSDIMASMEPLLGHRPDFSCSVTCNVSTRARNDIHSVIRESLANVAKHASANRTYVRVECDLDHLTVTVLDDGVGISSTPASGHGLANLRHRAESYGGTVAVKARSSRSGTRVSWRIPCSAAADDVA
jgi:signal transduction histidine kinase